MVDAAFATWIWPLLGIIFLPFATLMYVILYMPGVGLTGWEWFWVVFAALSGHRSLGSERDAAPAVPGYPAAG